jgi:hypothetical protein
VKSVSWKKINFSVLEPLELFHFPYNRFSRIEAHDVFVPFRTCCHSQGATLLIAVFWVALVSPLQMQEAHKRSYHIKVAFCEEGRILLLPGGGKSLSLLIAHPLSPHYQPTLPPIHAGAWTLRPNVQPVSITVELSRGFGGKSVTVFCCTRWQ